MMTGCWGVLLPLLKASALSRQPEASEWNNVSRQGKQLELDSSFYYEAIR